MINRRFKVGDRVKFTQKAKDRFEDSGYWHHANYPQINLNGVYTVKRVNDKNWPSVFLGEGTAPHTPTYLLEPAETQKNKNMQKKDFILALVQAIFPNQDLTYEGCKPYPRVNTGLDLIDLIAVKSPKDKEGNVQLTLSPAYGQFDKTDLELATEFLDQDCDLNCPEDAIRVTDNGDLVMNFEDYPWHMVSEIKPLEQSPVKEEQVQALQAEVQQLRAENERLKAQTYTIEIPQGVTSICLNLKG